MASTVSARSEGTTRTVRVVRRHPVATFLAAAHVGLFSAFVPVLYLNANPRLFSAIGVVFGVALPAFLITAVTGGKDAVRDLVRRGVHWRVSPGWWVFAVFGIPLGVLAAGPVIGDRYTWSGADLTALVTQFLPQALLALVTIQLLEEIGWSGFAQHTLQRRHGALKAAVLLAPAFATVHIPMYFIGHPITAATAAAVLAQMAFVIPVAAFVRILLAWVYNGTARSVLLVAVLHASFNTASGAEFLDRVGASPLIAMLPIAVAVATALVVLAATRGRLGHDREVPGPVRP